jgi:hypothetical protein
MNALPLTIESLVSILLLLTILYCVRLNGQLRQLKADESALKATIAELITATEKAERAIAGLKATARDADDTLGESLRSADRFAAEIRSGIAAGTEVLNRLAQIADARQWLAGVQPKSPAKPAAPDPKAISEAAEAIAERARARSKMKAA